MECLDHHYKRHQESPTSMFVHRLEEVEPRAMKRNRMAHYAKLVRLRKCFHMMPVPLCAHFITHNYIDS